MRSLLSVALLASIGCGGAATPAPVTSRAATRKANKTGARRGRPKQELQISGLEGTLQAYDVQEAMKPRMSALAECQRRRIRKVPFMAGEIRLGIHVLRDGKVNQVAVLRSQLGDVQTEQCVTNVVLNTRFPRPHGGEADVTWNMILDPLSGRTPEAVQAENLVEPLELLVPDASEACQLEASMPPVTVTAYVAPNGHVRSAGAAAAEPVPSEHLTCIAEQVRAWQLPHGKRIAKASFELRYLPPLNDEDRQAIHKRHARKRKVEARQRKAEARRSRAQAKRDRAKRKRHRSTLVARGR